jgi:hypothetical protein
VTAPADTAPTCACDWDCGAAIYRGRYGQACYRRWNRAGRPAGGPPPPMSPERRAALGGQKFRENRRAADIATAGHPADGDDAPALEPDEYDLAWLAGEPDRRAERVKPLARDWIRCVHQSDAGGLQILAGKVQDWPALAVVLAECASPERVLVATGAPERRSVTA